MEKNIVYLVLAALIVFIIPIVPQMVRVRIAVLRFLKLNVFADFHERFYNGLVMVVRIFLAVLAIVLLILAAGGF